MTGNQEEDAGEPLLSQEPSPSADDHEDIEGIEGFLGILPADKEFDSVASCIAELMCFFAPMDSRWSLLCVVRDRKVTHIHIASLLVPS